MANKLYFDGVIRYIGPVEEKGAKGFRVCKMVVEEEGVDKYPQSALIEWSGKQADTPASCAVGDPVRVHFNLGAREYNGMWYGSLRGWKIEPIEHVADRTRTATAEPQQDREPDAAVEKQAAATVDDESMPF